MAATLSVAASGIAVAQVAGQVGKTIVKMKQLWDDFRDVPASIADLLDQIDCLDPAIWEAEHVFGQAKLPPMFWNDSIGNHSTTYCRKALNSLNEIVNELTIQLNRTGKFRGTIARANAVLNKERLKRLEGRLHNAVMMLSLAQQSYVVALTRMHPDIITQRFAEIAPRIIKEALQTDGQLNLLEGTGTSRRQLPSRIVELTDDDNNDDDDKLYSRTLVHPRPIQTQSAVSRFRFRLPLWLCRRTWELQSSSSFGNWKTNLLYYRTVPDDSDVIHTASAGSPVALHKLFMSGLASPYDRDSAGYTLLHCAIFSHNLPVLDFLLDMGVSALEPNDHGRTPIDVFQRTTYNYSGRLLDWTAVRGIHAFFDDLSGFNDEQCRCRYGLLSRDCHRLFRHFECPAHDITSPESRLRNLLLRSPFIRDPMLIPELLEPYWGQDIKALFIQSEIHNCPLIHTIAIGLGVCPDEDRTEWIAVIDIAIRNARNIHHVLKKDQHPGGFFGELQVSALVWLIASFMRYNLGYTNLTRVNNWLQLWLSRIKTSGHDLEDYGRRENELLATMSLHSRRLLITRFEHLLDSGGDGMWVSVDPPKIAWLRGYQYGPKPEDWKILWSFREKSYAADFWRFVENEHQPVPGAWIDDSDDDDDGSPY